MLKFLKNLFANPYDKAAEEFLEEIKRLEPEKIQLDISEPVLSFVDCVKENRKRFIISHKEKQESLEFGASQKGSVARSSNKLWTFKDLVTGERWEYSSDIMKGNRIYGCEFLTEDEKKYIFKELGDFYFERRSRLAEIRHIRRNRKNVIERERLKAVYCQ